MRVLVSADMEGVTGVVHPDDVEPGGAAYQESRHLMTGDVNAAAAGLFDGGATQVLVNDAHYTMRNLVLAELDPRVEYVRGSAKPLGMLHGLRDVDAVAFVGYHAGAGQPGVLAHCYLATSFVEVRVDGVPTSEGRMNALVAHEAGRPVLLVTGDDVTVADAGEYAPEATGVVVKTAVGRYSARVLPPGRTGPMIREAARAALHRGPAAPSVPGPPPGGHVVEVDVDSSNVAVAAARVPGVQQVGPRQVRYGCPTMGAGLEIFRVIAVVCGGALHDLWG